VSAIPPKEDLKGEDTMVLSRALARFLITTFAVVTAVVVVPGVAHAKPPSNDDFDNATAISALPFAVQQDTTEASQAPDDPYGCEGQRPEGNVWFSYTATENGLIRASTAGSNYPTLVGTFTGLRRELYLVENGCDAGWTDATVTVRVTAGTTYYFMVGAYYDSSGGQLSFTVDKIASAVNDNFASAERVTTLPFTREPDLTTASFETDEPTTTCLSDEFAPSVWYAYTTPGPAMSVTARLESNYAISAVTVYTGNSLPELRETTCKRNDYYDRAVFRANPGTVYYIRVAGQHRDAVRLTLDEAHVLQPGVSTSVSEPTVYDTVRFEATSQHDIDKPMTVEWDFGDRVTTPPTTEPVQHRYTADGVYKVTLRATSPDGRTGTTTRDIIVKTHDVSIERFDVPEKAREGDSKSIKVHIANTWYGERVTVKLYKNSGSEWASVGELTLEVPAHRDRTVQFPFSYTFTPQDAVVGKVTFRAVAELPYPVRDALRLDNEAISFATKVRPRTAEMDAE
jgi:hypothetical protein